VSTFLSEAGVPISYGKNGIHCPPIHKIRYSVQESFYVKNPFGEKGIDSGWSTTQLEHNTIIQKRFLAIPGNADTLVTEQGFRENTITPPIGHADIIADSIEFIASYNTPYHNCKYAYHNAHSTPTGGGVEQGIPHFFYMTPHIRSTSGLQRHSCRVAPVNNTDQRKDEICHLEIPALEYPDLQTFLNNVSPLVLCNITGIVTGAPKTYNAIKQQMIPPLQTPYYVLLEETAKTHPLHNHTTAPIEYCRSFNPEHCGFLLPYVPYSNQFFVAYSLKSSL
jgi:hypothetical protein